MPVRTRAHDYSVPTEEWYNAQISQYQQKIINRSKKLKHMSHLKKMIHIQKMFVFSVNLVHTYVDFLKTPYVSIERMEKIEAFLRTVISKKQALETEHDFVYWLLDIEDKELYEKHYVKLMNNCREANALIFDYFNHKYASILVKSNADVYRHIMTFL